MYKIIIMCVATVKFANALTNTAPSGTTYTSASRVTTHHANQDAAHTPDTVLVFGAGGGTGKETTRLLGRRGFASVGMLRAKYASQKPTNTLFDAAASWPGISFASPSGDKHARNVIGDVCNLSDVQACFDAANSPIRGVVIVLGGDVDDVGSNMLTIGTRNIVQCMHRNGIKRVAVVTSVGVGDSYLQAPFLFRQLIKTVYKPMFMDKNRQESLFTLSSGPGARMEWCVVRPGGLSDDVARGPVVTSRVVSARIPRADVAAFCVDVVAGPDTSRYLRKALCIQGME